VRFLENDESDVEKNAPEGFGESPRSWIKPWKGKSHLERMRDVRTRKLGTKGSNLYEYASIKKIQDQRKRKQRDVYYKSVSTNWKKGYHRIRRSKPGKGDMKFVSVKPSDELNELVLEESNSKGKTSKKRKFHEKEIRLGGSLRRRQGITEGEFEGREKNLKSF